LERLDLVYDVHEVPAEAVYEVHDFASDLTREDGAGSSVIPDPATTPSQEELAPPWRGVRVHWGRERGDLAVRDPYDGSWHEIAFREAPKSWQRAVWEDR
jgi:hypothetical protein